MILPPFDHSKKQWDKYHEFHINHTRGYGVMFVQFETGEVICVDRCDGDPDKRRVYKDLNLRIVGTNDEDCPRLMTPDKTPVKKAWLNQDGQQILIIDLCNGSATALKGYDMPYSSRGKIRDTQPEWVKRKPVRFRGKCCAYIAGPGEPVISAQITVSEPRKLTADEKAHADSLKAAIKAQRYLDTEGNPDALEIRSWDLPAHYKYPVKVADLMHLRFDTMNKHLQQSLLTYGVEPPRVVTQYDRLLIDERSPITETA